jgi:hypothetical protein
LLGRIVILDAKFFRSSNLFCVARKQLHSSAERDRQLKI